MGDSYPITSSLTTPGQVSTVSNAIIAVCTFPANAVPCTNKATTYTSVTLGTPCSTSTQVVLAGTSSCVSTTDGRGNWGAWVVPGNYDFTVTVSTGQSFGPFTVSVGPVGIFASNNTWTGTNTWTNSSTFNAGLTSTNITSTNITSASANPASAGFIRMGTSDQIRWRNGANTNDMQLLLSPASGGYPADLLAFETAGGAGNLAAGSFIQDGASATIATAGAFRLHSSDEIHWRNNANNADIVLSKTVGDSIAGPSFTSTTFANPSLTGGFRMGNQDTITARNSGNSADAPLLNLDSINNINIGSTIFNVVLIGGSAQVGGATATFSSIQPSGTSNGAPTTLTATNGVGAGTHTGGNITITAGAGNNGGANGTISMTGGYFYPTAFLFANLGTPANGALVFCSDCTIANPCAGGGAGAMAKRLNGIWVCN